MRALHLTILVATATSSFALRPNMPISIAEIFWPPSMNYLAWIPGDEYCICSSAVPIQEKKVFSIGGEDGFTFEGYWKTSMKLMKDGVEVADCKVGPDAMKLDSCEPTRDRERPIGLVTKRWNCWTRAKQGKLDDVSTGGSGTRGGAAKPYWES